MLAVLGALFANGLIALLKLVAAVITGSSGMMAEALHSVADTTNQIFLLLGLRFYKRPASGKHPFGLRERTVLLVFHSSDFHFRCWCDLRDLRRHRKTRASTSADQLELGLWRTRHLVCAGKRYR